MSYILDALRRADSERERGSIPGLHAQPAALVAADEPSHSRLKRWLWPVLALPVVLLGFQAWRMMAQESAPNMTQPSAAAPVPARPAAALPAAPINAPADSAAVAPREEATLPPAAPPAIAAPSAETAAPPPKPLPAPRVATAPAAPTVKQQPKVQATTAAKADAPAGTAPSDNRVPSLNELPEDLRRQLPALTISGSSYSANPAHRMLIINGQVFHEGERPAAELVLEQIRPNVAVLSFRGQRYSLTH